MAAAGVFRPIRPSYPTWLDIVFNAVQNLALLHPDRQFFHYYHDICRYIDKNWEQLAGGKPRSPTWPNTVSSTVTCNKTVFRAGPTSGLWGLREDAISEVAPSPAPSPRKRRLPPASHSARRRAYLSSAGSSDSEDEQSLSLASESESRSRSPEPDAAEDQVVDIEGLSSEDKMDEETPPQRGTPPQDCPAPAPSQHPAACDFVPFAAPMPLACSPHTYLPLARPHCAIPGTSPLGTSPSWPHSFGTQALVRDDWFSSLFTE